MNLAAVAVMVRSGLNVVTTARGNSMEPIVKNGSKVKIGPVYENPKVGDVVLARVRGKYYLHLVSAIQGERYQISNNRGHVNGWASEIVGVLVKDDADDL